MLTGVRTVIAAGVVVLLTVGYFASKHVSRADSSTPPWIYGKTNSRFTIVLYADLKCPYCRDYFPVLLRWIDAHDDVRLQWQHRPLEAHEPSAANDAVQTECAGRVGGSREFWRAVTRHYTSAEYVPPSSAAFQSCIINGAAAAWVQAQATDASADGITATPTLLLVDAETGKTLRLEGPVPGDALLSAFDQLLMPGQSQFKRSNYAGIEAQPRR